MRSRSWSVPAYCFDSPRNVCLSVPHMPEYVTFIRTAPGAGSGRGKRSTSSRPGAFITAARTLPLTRLERFRISTRGLELPSVVGVGCGQPPASRAGHHVQVVQVVAGAGGHRVVAARHEHDIPIAHLDRLVERTVVRVDELYGETVGARQPVVVGL